MALQYMQIQQGKQEAANTKAQAKAQAAWNMYNSKVALREAEAEAAASRFESAQAKKTAKMLQAKQRAAVGASGVTSEGSPLLVMEDTAAELATEAANIRMTGQRRAQAFKSQSILDVSKAKTGLSIGKSVAAGQRRAGYIRAAETTVGMMG